MKNISRTISTTTIVFGKVMPDGAMQDNYKELVVVEASEKEINKEIANVLRTEMGVFAKSSATTETVYTLSLDGFIAAANAEKAGAETEGSK